MSDKEGANTFANIVWGWVSLIHGMDAFVRNADALYKSGLLTEAQHKRAVSNGFVRMVDYHVQAERAMEFTDMKESYAYYKAGRDGSRFRRGITTHGEYWSEYERWIASECEHDRVLGDGHCAACCSYRAYEASQEV